MKGSFHLTGDNKEIVELDNVLQRCLAIDRTERFASVAELQHRLIPAIRNCPPFVSKYSVYQAETIMDKKN